jgi:hypothetical protein
MSAEELKLPLYQCHKKVRAVKIKAIEKQKWDRDLGVTHWRIFPQVFPEGSVLPFDVEHSYMDKHEAQVGGYYVRYEDGYESYSPAKAFEDGYHLIEETTPLPTLQTAITNTPALPNSSIVTQTLPKFGGVTCRGSFELGTACGQCAQCRYYTSLYKFRDM